MPRGASLGWPAPASIPTLIVTLLLTFGCSGQDSPTGGTPVQPPPVQPPPPPPPPPPAPVPPACRDLRLSDAQSRPGRLIEVRGLTEALIEGGLAADLRTEGLESPLVNAIDVQEGLLVADMTVPLHPVRLLEGGPVEVVISGGSIQCPPLPLTIEPLPAAPGELRRGLEAFEELLLPQINATGFSVDDLLVARIDTLPAEIIPAAATLQSIRGPGNPNALTALFAGTAPILEGVTPDLSLIDALLASVGFVEQIRSLEASLAPLGLLSPTRASPDATAVATAASDPAQAVFRQPRTAEDLDDMMARQEFYGDLTTEAMEAAFATASVALATFALMTGGVLAPAVAASASIAGTALSVMGLYFKTMAGTLPSELEPLSLDVREAKYLEDDTILTGFWVGRITAFSTGTKFSIPDILSVVPGVEKLNRWIALAKNRAPYLTEFTERVASWTESVVITAWQGNPGTTFDHPPTTWGPIAIEPERDSDYFMWSMDGEAFTLLPEGWRYRAEQAGEADLILETRSPRFQNQRRSVKARLEVPPIRVSVRGPNGFNRIDMKPGESVRFEASVEDARSKCVDWRADAGTIQSNRDCNTPAASYVAPEEPGTYLIEAESSSRTGLRASGLPPRIGTMIVRVGGLRLSPRPSCVEPGQQIQFTATFAGAPIAFSELKREVTNGSLDADGTFTAGNEGTATVTVTLADNDEIADEVQITIRSLCTDWGLVMSGSRAYAGSGICVRYQPGTIWDGDPLAPQSFGRPAFIWVYADDMTFLAMKAVPGDGSLTNWGFPLGPKDGPPLESNDFERVGMIFKDGDGFSMERTEKPTFRYTWTEDPDSPLHSIISGTISGTLYRAPPSAIEESGLKNPPPPDPVIFTLNFRGALHLQTQEAASLNCDGDRDTYDDDG
jgi:hypothetical protein